MTRPLRVVSGDEIYPALRDALAGGPAILPRPASAAVEVGHSAVPAAPEEPTGRPHADSGTPGDSTPRDVRPADGSPADAGLPRTVPQRVALVVETSGSTGVSKRVALSADALLASAAASDALLGGPGQWLLALPTHYIAGLNVLTRSIAAESEPVALAGEHFTPAAFIEATGRMEWPRRYTSLVPAQLSRLLDAPEAHPALASFERILVGGQATPAALLERARAAGARVTRTYGSSETSGGCVYDGVPFGTVEVRIVDGEIQLTGPVLAEGYLGDPELTARRFVDGWYHTGDTGEVLDGRLRVTGRLDDVIISGGVKVSLGVVERLARELPGLADVVVVRAPDAAWGEVPVLVSEHPVDLDSVRAAVAASAGPAARPDRVLLVERMPLLASGKPDRRRLADLARDQSPT
ncbi:AMP-binding protein [Salinibacterium sp. ZJ454]|uniref:AMP-binding protein n=1 Tax=Salinibacterium sp. ZJ454 TaxID=2708339 RepID=UPI001AB01FBA|nr:AMP-binding protein [Salinibacterium sp. ZJ454]